MKLLLIAGMLISPAFILQAQNPGAQFDSIETRFLKNGAFRHPLFSHDRQRCIDSAIAVAPADAYLWQQRGMPYFKQRKHSLGMKYLDRAVELDPLTWLDYRAYLKCIFVKDYEGALADLKTCLQLIDGAYIMDHSHEFYIGLSFLQLEQFDSASAYFSKSINRAIKRQGSEAVHFVDVFYLGIAEYELEHYAKAITCFDSALAVYRNFADAEFYKSKCLRALKKVIEADELMEQAAIHLKEGKTINEDNVIYEMYPYQISAWYFPRK